MTGERVFLYNKQDGFVARKGTISNELITAGKFTYHGTPLSLDSFTYGFYPWIATVKSNPSTGCNTGFIVAGFGYLWSYVTPPGPYEWGETIWLDDEGNIWASPQSGEIAIIPWSVWGRSSDFLVKSANCDGYFVLGNDKIFTRDGKTLCAYDKNFNLVWDTELNCTPREVYWKESINGLVVPSEDGHCVMLIDGDNGDIIANQNLGGPVYDVTVDKWDNYRALQIDYIRTLYETDLKHLEEGDIRICNGVSTSISANSFRDIAIERGSNYPLVYLACFDYTKHIGDNDFSSLEPPLPHSHLSPIGGRGAYLVNTSSRRHFFIYERQTDFSFFNFEIYTSYLFTDFIINTKGDGGLSQYLIWGRNWRPLIEAVFFFLFGRTLSLESQPSQMVHLANTKWGNVALRTPAARRLYIELNANVELDMTSSIAEFPFIRRLDNQAFVCDSSRCREIEFLYPEEMYFSDHVYVDSAGRIWTLDEEYRSFRFFLPEAGYILSSMSFPVTDIRTTIFTVSDKYAFVAGNNKVYVYSRNDTLLAILGTVGVDTPHEMYWDNRNECLFVRSTNQISIIGLNEKNEPILLDSLSITEGTFGVAIDKYARYWLLLSNNKINVYEVEESGNAKKFKLVETKPAIVLDSSSENTAQFICENSKYDILVAVNVQGETPHLWQEEGGAPVYIWTASGDYTNVIRASLGRDFFKGVVPFGNEGWLLYRDNNITLFDFYSQEYYTLSYGSPTWGDPGLGRHLTWGTISPNKNPLLGFLEG